MDDQEILDLFFTRSESAVAELDAKYGTLLYSLARRMLHNSEDAAECENDAYHSAWRAIPPARPEKLAAWMCAVVRNGAVSTLRKRHVRQPAGPDMPFYELTAALPAPGNVSDELDAKELAASIGRFLGALNRENRVIFMRRYWFADSIRDISRLTGLTEAAVKVRLTRLRARLKKHLAEQEVYV